MTKPHLPTHSATVHAGQLKRALAFVQQTIERRNTIPVLGMVRIDFGLTCDATVAGTDLDIELETNFQAVTVAGGPFTVILPPEPVSGFLRACANGEMISITVGVGRVITLASEADGCRMTVREMCPPADWPIFAVGDRRPGQCTEVANETMRRALAATVPCISTEETRYYLNGVYLHSKGDGLLACATDGHRMALYSTDAPYDLPNAILPAKAAKILLRAMGKGNGAPITVEAWWRADSDSAARLRFSGDGWTIRSKTIGGTFPDYTRVMPKPDREVKISATISAAALRRLPNMGGTFVAAASVEIEPDAGRMSVAADGIIASAPVTGHGGAFSLNIKYLRAITYAAGTVKLEGLTASDPFTVLTEDPALSYVIMPIKVQPRRGENK